MLKDYEGEILIRMLEKEIIGMNYTSAERVASKIKWSDIANRFRVKKSFQSVIRELMSKQLVTDHGKSGRVVSLTKVGIDLAVYLKGKRQT
jgi:predicted transcriptional regulator